MLVTNLPTYLLTGVGSEILTHLNKKIQIFTEFWINVLISPADIGNWKMNYTSSAQIQQNNFPTEYSNDICFDCCSGLFSKSAFVDLKSRI